MNELITYGVSSLLICFTVLTFILSRFPADTYPEEYEFSLDPFWYIFAVMFFGATAVYFLFPQIPDMVKEYSYSTDILLPFLFALIIYFFYLLDLGKLANLLTYAAALAISFMQPESFVLFPEKLTFLQDRFVTAFIIFLISKGLGLLNGMGGIASMQFCSVMATAILLAYFNALPQLLCVLAATYLGTMIAFSFFSLPPEKIVISPNAFSAFGFIMGCFMLNCAVEFSDAAIFVAGSYLFTELGLALYNRFIAGEKEMTLYMNTAYFKASNGGMYDAGVVLGVLKILVIDIVLALMQIAAIERLALPVFSIALNLWFLSILTGETNPEELFSLTKWGKNKIKGFFVKKNDTTSK